MIAGDQQALTYQEIAHAIRRMPRRMDRGQFKITQCQALAIRRLTLRHEAFILTPIVGRRQSNDRCTGAARKLRRQRRMIAMGMSGDDPANGRARRFQNGLKVRRLVGSRIENSDLILAQQIGVCAWTRHHSGIAGHDAAYSARQGVGKTWSKLRSSVQSRTSYIRNH